MIFNQGDYAPCMYDIVQGRGGIYVGYGTPQEKLLTELKPGECFGEMGLLESSPRSATAVALEDGTQLQVITGETFDAYFHENPDKIVAVMRQMSGRIRSLTNDYMEVCRAVAESVEADKAGKEKSGGLRSRLKKIADAYSESMRLAAQYGGQTYDPMAYYYGIVHW